MTAKCEGNGTFGKQLKEGGFATCSILEPGYVVEPLLASHVIGLGLRKGRSYDQPMVNLKSSHV
jgi:hypothetical protein